MIARCNKCSGKDNASPAGKFQDATYGVGRRVFTEGKSSYCTVCGERGEGTSSKGGTGKPEAKPAA